MLGLGDTPCPLKPVLQFPFSRRLGGEEFLPLLLHTRRDASVDRLSTL